MIQLKTKISQKFDQILIDHFKNCVIYDNHTPIGIDFIKADEYDDNLSNLGIIVIRDNLRDSHEQARDFIKDYNLDYLFTSHPLRYHAEKIRYWANTWPRPKKDPRFKLPHKLMHYDLDIYVPTELVTKIVTLNYAQS